MDTRLKNSHKRGITAVLLLLAVCSAIMMSRYRSISIYLDHLPAAEASSFREVLSTISQDMAAGNYLLYNEYARETEPEDVLYDYGQREFDLTRRYLDYELFGASGDVLTNEPGDADASADAGAAEEIDASAGAGNNEADAKAERLTTESEEEADYAFRAEYTFSAGGELAGLQIDGTALSPEEEYELESEFLSAAQQVAWEGYISSIASPENTTIIYGMDDENMELFMQEYAWTEPVTVSVDNTTYYRDTLEILFVLLLAAALLLPLRKKLDISGMKLFEVPFEAAAFGSILIAAFALDGPAGWVVEETIEGRILPGMYEGAGIELLAGVLNFAMWFVIFGAFFWCITSMRAMLRMKGAYWRERTLTMKLVRHFRGRGTEDDEKLVRRAGSILKRIRAFFARQYDALQHIDFREKTNRTILKIVIVNYIILTVVCFLWYYGMLALIIYSVLLFLFLRKYVRDLQEKYKLLLQSTNQLADGHLDAPIEGDIGLFNPIQEELKKIQQGFKKAVDEEVKNERMKTELVTNVSHDLRTPLTAIITYTDLLKQETDDKKRKEYIEVLEKKSQRLKVLIEDLFEISKAASKNIVMHFMKVDIVDLIKQVGLENDGKIKEANLDFRWKLPEHKLVMWLDSQKTYRIFENLIVNITKYAMPHTRVYIEMTEGESDVHISMKNVSASELDFDAEEITDRFVRGDSSRNTEGSGLGLAIAKSFVELQHGTLKISTEADLFRADISLPKLPVPPEEEQQEERQKEQQSQQEK
ncbi:MAG TPA: HAMP domain-containing histidine kinase [Candidatus Mediterraneibacter merdipullorum]|nr:HAMP domain-containing histidine kinase [Candidatus Mediterraneibacter merdipullorum]